MSEERDPLTDQPLPVGNGHRPVHEQVIEDLQARLALGVRKYGQPLQPFNGRNALQDVYEELLDAAVYVKQCLIEGEAVERDFDWGERAEEGLRRGIVKGTYTREQKRDQIVMEKDGESE